MDTICHNDRDDTAMWYEERHGLLPQYVATIDHSLNHDHPNIQSWLELQTIHPQYYHHCQRHIKTYRITYHETQTTSCHTNDDKKHHHHQREREKNIHAKGWSPHENERERRHSKAGYGSSSTQLCVREIEIATRHNPRGFRLMTRTASAKANACTISHSLPCFSLQKKVACFAVRVFDG